MEQIKLKNGSLYDLVPGGVLDLGDDRLQIIVLPGEKSFMDIEGDFENDSNTKKITVLDSTGESVIVKNDYTVLESVTKNLNYVTGSEEHMDEEGEKSHRDARETVYIITLSKPDLWTQVKNLQEAVDLLVLSELEV